MNLQLIFLGAPGSGKGTQAKNLRESHGFEHLSTGDLLRNEIAKNSEIGKKVKGIISAGQLVDDQTVIALLKLNCDLSNKNYIFDGFPRNLEQAKMLDEQVLGNHPYKAIYFEVDYELLVKRVVYRRTCGDCGKIYNLIFSPPVKDGICDKCNGQKLLQREDDKEEVLRKRYDIFRNAMNELNDYYQQKNVLIKIDAFGDQESIYQSLKDALS